jgi:hypothetical protein
MLIDCRHQHIEYIREKERNGEKSWARDLRNLKTRGQYFLHEVMHLRSTYFPEPKINDERFQEGGTRIYGAESVYKQANLIREVDGGGALLGSTNADTYAITASAIYWWDTLGIWPWPNWNKYKDNDPPDRQSPWIHIQYDSPSDVNPTYIENAFQAQLAVLRNTEPYNDRNGHEVLYRSGFPGGIDMAGGADLRILTVGDSITAGFLSRDDGGDGNGYRKKLKDNLSRKLPPPT